MTTQRLFLKEGIRFHEKSLGSIFDWGVVFGLIGALIGVMSDLTLEDASGGFLIGWILGEIIGTAVITDSKQGR